MMLLIVGLELIAAISSAIAVIYAALLFRRTRKASALWFFMLLAMISLLVLRALVTIEWLGIQAEIMDNLQLVFYVMTVSYLLGFAYLSRSGLLKPV